MALQSLLLWSLSVGFMSHFRNAVLYLQFYMTGSFIVFLVIVYFLVILFLGKQGCDASCDFHCITKLSHQLPVSTTAELVIICIFIGNQKHNTVIMLDTFTIAHKSVKICTSKKLGNQKLQLSFLFFFNLSTFNMLPKPNYNIFICGIFCQMGFFGSAYSDVVILIICLATDAALRHNSIRFQGGDDGVFWEDYKQKVVVSKPSCQSMLHRGPHQPHPPLSANSWFIHH